VNFLQLVGMCGQGFMMGPGLGSIISRSIAASGCHERPEGFTDYGFLFDELSINRSFDHAELLS